MQYEVNNIPLSDFGFTPGRDSNSNLAISGCWDMPARIGKTHHDWRDENSIEPYLRADEIFFGGRDITLFGYIQGENRSECISKVQTLYDFIDSATEGLFTLSSEFGSWEVQIIDQVVGVYMSQGFCNLTLKFREPVISFNGALPEIEIGGVGIDGFTFSQLGVVKTLTKDQLTRPLVKQLENTSYGYEQISSVKRDFRTINLDFFIDTPSYVDFLSVVNNLSYLFSLPNARTLKLDDGTTREVFIKDGFKISGVRKIRERFVAFLSIPFSEIRLLENWNKLTDKSGLILVDQYGQPLTEILKKF